MLTNLPVNEWVVLHERLPNIPYESAAAYDPNVRRIVYLAAHIGRLYPQSNYAVLYDFRLNRFFLSQAMYRPQRRCLIAADYLDSVRRVLSCNGSMSHGSMPEGALGGNHTALERKASVGPWLYDAVDDDWMDCRPLGAQWRPRSFAPVAYEPSSDLLAGLGTTDLMLYRPWTNQVSSRPLPQALGNRSGYAIAADPVHRVLVVFGGVDRDVKGEGLSPDEVHERSAKADTWVYDTVNDTWRQCKPKTTPPRGMPMNGSISLAMTYHDPSGTCLLLQPNIDALQADPAKWGGTTLWGFDVASDEWTKVETKNAPLVHGLLEYAPQEDALVLIGGGLDGVFDDERTNASPALSRLVQACRLRVAGRDVHPPVSQPARVTAAATPGGTRVEWTAERGIPYEVFRAEAHPLVGAYAKVSAKPVLGSEFTDRGARPGTAYAYQVVAVGAQGRRSLPAFTQPLRPAGLWVSVEAATAVHLRWQPNAETDLAGYHVYRADGKDIEAGKGTRLTERPVAVPRFVDAGVDLSDGVIRGYWVVAVSRFGVESGASPLGYTVPDAPRGFTVMEGVGPSNSRGLKLGYELSWDWPKDVKVAGFNLYHATQHLNTFEHPQHYDAFWPLWTQLNDEPLTKSEFAFSISKENPPNHYFYVRAVNLLGQEGFFTDIVSPTDGQYRPAQP